MTNFTVVGSGISGQLMFGQESLNATGTWGVLPAGVVSGGAQNIAIPLEFKSESLAMKKTTVQGQGLHAGGLFDRLGRRVLTNYDAGGTINFDLPNRGILQLLMHMTGSPNTTVTAASSLYTPTQIATSGAYKSYHSPGSTGGMSLWFQKGVPSADAAGSNIIEPFTYPGCKISEWEMSVDTGAIVQMAMNIDARNELGGTVAAGNGDPLNTSVPSILSFTESNISSTTDPLSVFHFRQATIFTGIGGILTSGVLTLNTPVAAGVVKSASMKETKSLDTSRYYVGSAGFKAEQIENGFRQLSGQLVVEFLSAETYYNAFSADSTTSLQIQLVGGVAGTSGVNADSLFITFPNIKLDGESPMLGGPGIVTENVGFTGLDDNSTAPYQILYISSDSTTTT